MTYSDSNNILSLLESLTAGSNEDIAMQLANDFRKRRIEKNLTRQNLSDQSNVAISNITRFEQKGLISLKHLIALAVALGYTHEITSIFATPKYSTMAELTQIRKNSGKTKAYPKHPRPWNTLNVYR